MTDPSTILRPVPRWVRVWAALTVTVALLLLFVLGGFVTSFRVGMADPVWPTEPWYLLGQDWKQLEFGFLVEHTHRAAGWIVGLMVSVLAVGAWASEPDRKLRWLGLGAIVFLLVAYGGFHREMSVIEKAHRAKQDVTGMPLPIASGAATLVGAGLCLAVCAISIRGGRFGRWARSMAVIALIAVMVQGLLGGFRVLRDQLYEGRLGPLLAAVHGAFGQVAFATLATVLFLSAPRRPNDALPDDDRSRLRATATLLPVAVFVQLVWGVWLRHAGAPVAQRLHVLTAFLIAGLAVWVAVRAIATDGGREKLRFAAYHLLGIVAVQVMLGVEGWMAKYGVVLDTSTGTVVRVGLPKEKEAMSAAIRTAHVVIGTALLASSVTFALRVWRKPLAATAEPVPATSHTADAAARFGEPVGRV